MSIDSRSPVAPRLVLGAFVALLGMLFLLDNFHVIDIEDAWRFWPVILIAFGLARALQPCGRAFGWILTGIGGVLLLDQLDLIRFDLWELWPLVLVLVGLRMVWSAIERGRGDGQGGTSSGSWLKAAAILGGSERGSNSQEFRGGEVTAVLGGCDLDLRQASIAGGEAVLDVFAFWGGIDVRVPEDWSVVVRATPMLGSVEDNTRRPATPTKQLVVKGSVVMGGVEIKN